MNPNTVQSLERAADNFKQGVRIAFQKTLAWVTKLSWWKFFLFAILAMIAGAILQDTLFSAEESVVITKKKADKKGNRSKAISDGDTNVEIDGTGIHIRKNKGDGKNKQIEIDQNGVRVKNGDDNDAGDTQTPHPAPSASDGTGAPEAAPAMPAPPAPPAAPMPKAGDDIHIKLPPEVAQEISNEIEDAVADAADEEVKSYKKKSSRWFGNFVVLLVVGLFGMKALLGGKARAEENAKVANAAAERESLLRQVSEAQMQMMQAQVEPHFLFNTLASVEHLIETDSPRAAAMQRSLIQYLRAVLPQMRENASITNLGREADMVKSYLDLLKMRMEERLEVDFIMPEGLRSASFPPMMLQSLVENAIKHGLEVKAEGGTLRFHAEVAHNKLRVSVTDNGLGFGAVPSNGTGLGLQNIRERLKLIYKEKGQMIITPNQPSGVCVTIEIPYELAN
ncbi:MAG: histidine kinase [Pseudomonadota bacterium]